MTTDIDSTRTPAGALVGTTLGGKYRVERVIGSIGTASLAVATHLQLDQQVLLKFVARPKRADPNEALHRLLRETRAAAHIRSEYVAAVLDIGTLDDGSPYLVMEYLEGQDLQAVLTVCPSLPVALAIDYAMQACEGLAEAHAAGIVHRDLKPSNVFLAQRADGSVRVKLLDFGMSNAPAGETAEPRATSARTLVGTPLYMAPEQMRTSKDPDARADIWSMGVTLYEMLAGRCPFAGGTLPQICARVLEDAPASLRALRDDIPPALEAAVMRCLEKDRERRFRNVAELALALAPFGTSEAPAAAERIARTIGRGMSSGMVPSGAPASTGYARKSTRPSEPGQTPSLLQASARHVLVGAGAAALSIVLVAGAIVRFNSVATANAAALIGPAPPPKSAEAEPVPSATLAPISIWTDGVSLSANSETETSSHLRAQAPARPSAKRTPDTNERTNAESTSVGTEGFGGRE